MYVGRAGNPIHIQEPIQPEPLNLNLNLKSDRATMKFLLAFVVVVGLAGSLAQGDAVVNAWLKKHGLSEYADELEELGAENREDLDYLEEGGA